MRSGDGRDEARSWRPPASRGETSDLLHGATETTGRTDGTGPFVAFVRSVAPFLGSVASRTGLVALSVLVLVAASVARAEIIDRVLAVVNGSIITLSDARAALQFGLVPPDVGTDPVAAALQRLIDRQLVLAEVERYAPPEPSAQEVAAAFAGVRDRFADELDFETALTRYGLTRDALRGFLRDRLRIESYLGQRFASVAQPSDEEIAAYYREHADDFRSGGELRPLAAVREEVRGRVAEARRETLIRDWLAGLRRRSSVVVLYLPER